MDNYLQFLKEINWKKIGEIPWVFDNSKLEEISKYFNCTKELTQDQYIVWKLLKSAMCVINKIREGENISFDEEVRSLIVLHDIAEGEICNEIKASLIIKA